MDLTARQVDMFFYPFLLLILLFLSAFYSGSETSLFSLSKIRVKRLKMHNERNSDIVESLLDKPTDLLITILIGNMFANVFASSVAASLSIERWGESAVGISIVVMTVIVVVFCEVMPKVLAIKKAERIALAVAPTISFFSRVVFPLRFVLSEFAERILSFAGGNSKKSDGDITIDELESAIKVGYTRGGILDKEEAEMMEDVLQLSDKKVEDVMVKSGDIVSFPADMDVEDMCIAIKEAELSRIPIYDGTKANIVGILYAKDLLKMKMERSDNGDIKGILREAFRVSKDMRLSVLLREFRTRKIHLALVEDNTQNIVGLVTLEDLLEEIIGDIQDKEMLVKRIKKRYKFLNGSS